jgi:hypothetical protein
MILAMTMRDDFINVTRYHVVDVAAKEVIRKRTRVANQNGGTRRTKRSGRTSKEKTMMETGRNIKTI